MPTTIRSVTPFFNNSTTPLPPFPAMLTDQLELFGTPHSPSTGRLASDSDSSEDGVSATPHNDTPVPNSTSKPVSRQFKLVRASSPYQKKTTPTPTGTSKKPQSRGVSLASSLSSLEDSDHTSVSSSDDTSSTLSDDSKIPKPPGEPGRPGRGGYNLETALDWNHKTFVKFKTFTHNLIDKHLDVTKCASAQSTALMKLVRDKVQDKFPDLENYSNCWPINDMIMMRLKYTSSRARRQEMEMAAGKRKSSKVGVYIPFCVLYSNAIVMLKALDTYSSVLYYWQFGVSQDLKIYW
ncbi:hypothetical protein JVT61DRAFT_3269 [Boletus reticuloceps]|uniref:Uncharacterized protein n=1 Tax=Boletus reticuloceps TaxID=495285 RepID=A0A8I2YH66_9AGAM|nr:hypothetical protein JVT61DRAFT_8895 [Boletus reticuloceps]KAG6375695.1 hypothetical protein JVT61DRAFT_3269 [Boletus reticuloceps]